MMDLVWQSGGTNSTAYPDHYVFVLNGWPGNGRAETTPPADIRYGSFLQRPGKLSIQCERVEVMKSSIRYYFPKSDPITMDDTSITFQTQIGRMWTEATFKLQEMVWDGKLAL